MVFLELTKKRYSVRSYTSQEVEKEKLDYIFECALPHLARQQPHRTERTEKRAQSAPQRGQL